MAVPCYKFVPESFVTNIVIAKYKIYHLLLHRFEINIGDLPSHEQNTAKVWESIMRWIIFLSLLL